jgi:hypothetical protein
MLESRRLWPIPFEAFSVSGSKPRTINSGRSVRLVALPPLYLLVASHSSECHVVMFGVVDPFQELGSQSTKQRRLWLQEAGNQRIARVMRLGMKDDEVRRGPIDRSE